MYVYTLYTRILWREEKCHSCKNTQIKYKSMLKLQSLCFHFLILIYTATPFLFQGYTFPTLLHVCVLSHFRHIRLFGTL